MINNCYYCVYDFETGGIDPSKCEPLELAAQIYHPRTLEPVEGGHFHTLIRPDNEKDVDPKALEKNGLKLEDLRTAPDRKTAFSLFEGFLKKYKKGKSDWDNPIPIGHNIASFDNVIIRRCMEKWPFHVNQMIDTYNLLFTFFENVSEPARLNADALRAYFGISDENAHTAKNDVLVTGDIAMRFLKFLRNVSAKTKFKGAFAQK